MGIVWVGQCDGCRRHDSFMQRIGDELYCGACMGYNGRPPKAPILAETISVEAVLERLDDVMKIADAFLGRECGWEKAIDSHERIHPPLDRPLCDSMKPTPPMSPPPPPRRPEIVLVKG